MQFFGQLLGIVLVAMLLQLSICAPTTEILTERQSNCIEVVFPVTVSTNCIGLAPSTTWQQGINLVTNTLSFLISLLFNSLVRDTFNIAGTYCEPQNFNASRTNTLQILQHGATYDRNFWTGDAEAFGTEYSWIDYASQQGYPTFAFDRLGAGLSDHPDPIIVVQLPTQAAVTNQIVQMARNGASPFPHQFHKIIVVGHSMGSAVTQKFSVDFPNVADCIILTGYSKYILNILAGIFITAGLLPAQIVSPDKFGNLPLGYLEPSSYSGILYLFWYDPYNNGTYYNPAFPVYDYPLRQALSVGEGATIAVPLAQSSMTGDVFVITGQQDTLLCGTTAMQGDGPGQCVGGPFNYLSTTSTLYPNARNYEWFNVPNSGHCWQFHFNAQLGFEVTHNWLASRGY